MNTNLYTNDHAEVVVVGGGIAGLYCAWRLLESGRAQKVIILEELKRLGGRLATSDVVVGQESVRVEEGGMRFVSRHVHLNWLLKQLAFVPDDIVDFGMGGDPNLYYIRSRRFTRKEAADSQIWSEVYNLGQEEQNKSPFDILNEVKAKIIQHNKGGELEHFNPSVPEQWQEFRCDMRWKGELLCNWGFRPLLQDCGLTNECIQMLIDTGGFACPFDRGINAGAAFQLMANFPSDPQFKTLVDGYQEVTNRLAQRIEALGGRLVTNCLVSSVDLTGDKFVLKTRAPDGRFKNFESTNVVLALPRRPLQRLAEASPALRYNLQLQESLKSVEHMPLTKMNFHYERKWWKHDFGIQHGPCFTDLPLAQVYFFDIPPDNQSQFGALTIYSDAARGEYWRQLQKVGDPFLTKTANIPSALEPCSKAVVEHATQFMCLLFGSQEIPKPVFASIRAWGLEGVGEGDHQWAIGHNDRDVLSFIWNPLNALFICGESFSDEQAWVEGALRSSEKVLQAGFGLEGLELSLPGQEAP